MKSSQAVLALIVATLLSAPAFADNAVDPVLASFERDMYRESSTQSDQPRQVQDEPDPLAEAIKAANVDNCGAQAQATSASRLRQANRAERLGG